MGQVKRKFDKEFKVEAVRMVTDGGLSKTEVGRRLGVSATLVAAREYIEAYDKK